MPQPVEPGVVIKGKYRVEHVLGKGGMGIVVAAHHTLLDQRVAIKVLLPEMLEHPTLVERFSREARALSKIDSDHIARVFDVDELPDGTPFMVMELLDGADLSSVKRSKKPLAPDIAVRAILEACEAIREAHRMQIIHRDIKPANLFLARRADGRMRVKVLDFGISKMTGSDATFTGVGAMIGSAPYMSPEQMLSSRDVDARSDVWSIGATLYELLTAKCPFWADSLPQVCAMVMSGQKPEPPSQRTSGIPEGLDGIVMRCLEKDPAKRFDSVAELAAALEPFARSTGTPESARDLAISLPIPSTPAPATFATSSTTVAVSRDPRFFSPGSRRSLALLVAAAAISVVVAGVMLFQRRGPQARAPEPTAAPVEAAATPPPHQEETNAATAAPSTDTPKSATPVAVASAPRPGAKPPKVPAGPVKPPVNCNPPFVIDADGIKHAKPQCL